MIKVEKIYMPLYRQTVVMIRYDQPKEFDSWFKKNHPHEELDVDPADFSAGTFVIDEIQYAAFDFSNKITHGTVAHESCHLVNRTFIDIRCQLDRYNDEPQAYLLQWYVEEITKFLKL